MLVKRVIPCLDIKDGRVVKGVNFINLIDAGDPVAIAKKYQEQGADELVFLDITATLEKRKTLIKLVQEVANEVFIPFTVGGGIDNLGLIEDLLKNGADKVSINSAAIYKEGFVKQASDYFGSQAIVVAIDAKMTANNKWEIFTHGGREPTGIDAFNWAYQMQKAGAGELLITSMDRDGTKNGFDLDLMRLINNKVNIPTIASGGVGNLAHLVDGIKIGQADAVLAASIFHFGTHTIAEAKEAMLNAGININPITNKIYNL